MTVTQPFASIPIQKLHNLKLKFYENFLGEILSFSRSSAVYTYIYADNNIRFKIDCPFQLPTPHKSGLSRQNLWPYIYTGQALCIFFKEILKVDRVSSSNRWWIWVKKSPYPYKPTDHCRLRLCHSCLASFIIWIFVDGLFIHAKLAADRYMCVRVWEDAK